MSEITLQHYYIDPVKNGAVLRAFIAGRGLSLSQIADETGIDYDTLRNYLRGKIQKVTIDCLLKILTVTEHTLDEYFTALFAMDDIHLYDSVVFAHAVQAENMTATAVHHTASPAPTVAELEHYAQRMDDINEHHVQRIAEQYERQIAHMEEWHKTEIALLESRHAQMQAHLEADIAQRDKEISILSEQLRIIQETEFGAFFGKRSDR